MAFWEFQMKFRVGGIHAILVIWLQDNTEEGGTYSAFKVMILPTRQQALFCFSNFIPHAPERIFVG